MSLLDGTAVCAAATSMSLCDGMAVCAAATSMSLRDYFAAAAMQGLLASGHFTAAAGYEGDQSWMTSHEDPWDDETGEKIHEGRRRFDFPEAAWRCADAMLAARKESE
jgi:hypothetical protein